MNDMQLLEDYASRNSQEAFAALVQRHINLVYSVALRQLGDAHKAQDVTQAIFILLAQKAERLDKNTVLTGWLYQTARLTSARFLRGELRRQRREQEAFMQSSLDNSSSAAPWEKLAPELDDALGRLGEGERNAILLRYFEDRSVPEVALALGLKEPAVKKRLARALEKLRSLFAKRGIAVSAGSLTAAITANSVQAAPAGLAGSIAGAIAAGGPAHIATAIAAAKVIAMTGLQKTIVVATVAALAGVGIYEARQAAALRTEIQTLRQQQGPWSMQIQQLQRERDEATNRLAGWLAENQRLKGRADDSELLRLRGEVAQLRAAQAAQKQNAPTAAAARTWLARVNQLKAYVEQHPEKEIPELQFLSFQNWLNAVEVDFKNQDDARRAQVFLLLSRAQSKFGDQIRFALQKYAEANQEQFPTELSQLRPYCAAKVAELLEQLYEIRPASTLPASEVKEHKIKSERVIVRKKPADPDSNSRGAVFADGAIWWEPKDR